VHLLLLGTSWTMAHLLCYIFCVGLQSSLEFLISLWVTAPHDWEARGKKMLTRFFSVMFTHARGGRRQLQTGRTQVPLVQSGIHSHFYPEDILQLFGFPFA